MKIWRLIVEFWEWLPILATPFVIALLTDDFTRPLDTETWLILALILAVNVGWFGAMRWVRRSAEFHKKFSGFRMKRNG